MITVVGLAASARPTRDRRPDRQAALRLCPPRSPRRHHRDHRHRGHVDIVIQEVTVEDQKPEYYIEVKAEEVPSEFELASALASLEEPSKENIEIFDDTSTHSIAESD